MHSTGFCIFCHYARRRGPCNHAVAALGPDTASDTDTVLPLDIGAALDDTGATLDLEDAALH